jgi:hypothetical protein
LLFFWLNSWYLFLKENDISSSNFYSFFLLLSFSFEVTFSCFSVLLVAKRNGFFLIILSCYHVYCFNISSFVCALCIERKWAVVLSVKGFFLFFFCGWQ